MVFLEVRIISEDRLQEAKQPLHAGLRPLYKAEVDTICLAAVIHQSGVL